MDEQRLDRMEDMLSKLITMVGNLNQQFQEMKNEQILMRSDNEKQFAKIHKTLAEIRSDQDYIWEKAVRNEREIAKLKGQLQF
jgi:hypothetical protein